MIYLIRHGETAGNRDRVVQVPETPLSERGIAQARRLGGRLADVGIVHILSSDMARAQMTAECVRETTRAPLELTPLLHERNFGDHRGTPYSELEVDIFAPGHAPPAGETWERFHERVDEAWLRVQQLAGGVEGHLAVVTHGLVCHSIAMRHIEVGEGALAGAGPDGPALRFDNTAVTTIEGPGPWRAVRFACTEHLDEDAAPGGRPPSESSAPV